MEVTLKGKVVKGKQRGRKLGFPTANFPLHRRIAQGIYVSQTSINGNMYPSVTFIGNAKTFDEKELKAETFILNFNTNIYGHWISLKLLKKLRGNKKFASKKDLIKQMEKDVKRAEEFFSLKVGERGLEPPTSRSQTARSTN